MSATKWLIRISKRLILTILAIVVGLVGLLLGYGLLCRFALQAKDDHESWFHHEFARLAIVDGYIWPKGKDPFAATRNRPTYNERINPAVHDIQQLWSANIEAQLSLNPNGTGIFPSQRYWIYIAGTAPERRPSWWKIGSYARSVLNHSSHDPPEMARSFNEAMNRLSEYFHNERKAETYWPMYRFVDGDMTPNLCDLFWVDPPVLVYLETKSPCRLRVRPNFSQACSVSASVLGLPLTKLPYHPTEKIGGYTVPVFPSAFNQLKMMMTSIDTTEALGLEDDVVRYIDIDPESEEYDDYGYASPLNYNTALEPKFENMILALAKLFRLV